MTLVLLGALSVLSAVGCQDRKSMDAIPIAQCFREYPYLPCEQKKASSDYCSRLSSEFKVDQERKCYAQKWSIPRAYFDRKYVAYAPATEIIVLGVGIPDLTPGALLSSDRRMPLFTEVKINALWSGRFERYVHHIQDTRYKTSGLQKTGSVMFGMEVYEQTRHRKDQYSDFFLFPSKNAQLFVSCVLKPGASIAEKDPNGPCQITANVDERAYLEYHIRYSNMKDLERINQGLVNLVRSFMHN